MAYRRDIDGLRALAVAVVVLFHVGVPAVHGGFAGVDVFFVISGYLITGIIIRGLESGTFSLGNFYVRRINRILPALLVILAAVWLIGWLVMFAREFRFLGRDIFAGSTFSSNFFFWSGLGYWDSTDKPLLHLWSLAVEEQFYLLWPLTLLVVGKTKRDVRWTIIAIIEISFVVNLYLVRHQQAPAAFYLPMARFWEILAGALLFQIENSADATGLRYRQLSPRFRDIVSVAGLVLLAATIAVARPHDAWPGLKGLLPVGGTLLLIAAGPNAIVNRTFLSNRAMVALGLISYPLYLWHWPLIVFGNLIFEKHVPLLYTVAVVPVSIALATLTFRFVERPIRFGKRKRRSALMLLPGLAAASVLGLIGWKGVTGTRIDESLASIDRKWGPVVRDPMERPETMTPGGPPIFVIRGDPSRQIVFYGDSHMLQYWARIENIEQRLGSKRPTALLMHYPGCAVFPDTNNPGQDWKGKSWQCDQFNHDVIAFASRPEVKALVISTYWERFIIDADLYPGPMQGAQFLRSDNPQTQRALAKFEEQIRNLVNSGKAVYIILSNPVAQVDVSGKIPRRISGAGTRARAPMSTRAYNLKMTRWSSNRLRQIAAKTGAIIIDPIRYMCDEAICPSVTPEGEPIYRDDDHLRASYVTRHAHWIDQVFSAVH
jgi:peptidoglycan/LPS O-acetylase OafA/YrhL